MTDPEREDVAAQTEDALQQLVETVRTSCFMLAKLPEVAELDGATALRLMARSLAAITIKVDVPPDEPDELELPAGPLSAPAEALARAYRRGRPCHN